MQEFKLLCIRLPDSPSGPATKILSTMPVVISQICAKSGNTGVHLNVKFEQLVKTMQKLIEGVQT